MVGDTDGSGGLGKVCQGFGPGDHEVPFLQDERGEPDHSGDLDEHISGGRH